MKLTNRNIHRDLAYFYVGLLLAFSFSGIILNHRQSWYPMEYAYESTDLELKLEKKEINNEILSSMLKDKNLLYESHRIRGNNLRIDLQDNGIIELPVTGGMGTLEYRRKVPIIGHTMYLHKTTNKFWIWYSDIFGVAMIVICITGMLIPIGKSGFSKRGWKLMIVGLIFPLLFLLFF